MAIMATPAHAEEVRCTYTVGREFGPAAVRENTDTNSTVLKAKYPDEDVTSKHSCGYEVLDPESGVHFVSVNLLQATDGEGWMRSRDLVNPR
jgi:hypothetical protein